MGDQAESIRDAIGARPSQGPEMRWSDMDPLIRARFHEFGNHITRLEGVIAGLSMRVPERPETVPLLEERVRTVQEGQSELKAALNTLSDKLNSLTLKIVGATSAVTAIAQLANHYLNN